MVRRDVLATGRRLGMMIVGLTIGVMSASTAFAQAPEQAAPVANQRLFANDGAMILNFIKPDKVADFEEVINKLKEGLAKSEKPERKQQAASWKVYRSPDPAGANVLFVFLIDPAVKGADYQISNIIAETYTPAEANEILTKYAAAYAQGMNIVNLNVLTELGK